MTNNKKSIYPRVDPQQFINVNTPLCSYILGLLWADGHVRMEHQYRVVLSTTYPDANHFIDLFLKTGKWGIHLSTPKIKTWKKRCDIYTGNKPLATFLYEHGYISKSNSSAEKILSIIPDSLKHYWIRGLLDGDGCIHINESLSSCIIHFCSSFDQDWSYLEKICNLLNIKYRIKQYNPEKEKGKYSKFFIEGKYKVNIFCEYIYKNYDTDRIGLQRKYEKYLIAKRMIEKVKDRGVYWDKKYKKWCAVKSINKKRIFLGRFINKNDAFFKVKKFCDFNLKNRL